LSGRTTLGSRSVPPSPGSRSHRRDTRRCRPCRTRRREDTSRPNSGSQPHTRKSTRLTARLDAASASQPLCLRRRRQRRIRRAGRPTGRAARLLSPESPSSPHLSDAVKKLAKRLELHGSGGSQTSRCATILGGDVCADRGPDSKNHRRTQLGTTDSTRPAGIPTVLFEPGATVPYQRRAVSQRERSPRASPGRHAAGLCG